jgi:hypothetical protein
MATDKKITELPAAGSITGAELFELVQGGVNKKSLLSDLSTLIAGDDFVTAIVSTGGTTITLNIDSKERGFFTGSASFSTPKDVVWAGDTRATQWTLMWEITDLAATLDFGPDTRAASNMTAGLFVGGVFTPLDVGSYKVVATRRYDDIWWLDFKGVYSVGDAPPEPDPTTFVLYDDDSEVLYNDTLNVEYQ